MKTGIIYKVVKNETILLETGIKSRAIILADEKGAKVFEIATNQIKF